MFILPLLCTSTLQYFRIITVLLHPLKKIKKGRFICFADTQPLIKSYFINIKKIMVKKFANSTTYANIHLNKTTNCVFTSDMTHLPLQFAKSVFLFNNLSNKKISRKKLAECSE